MPVLDFQHETTGEIISVLVPVTAPDAERHSQTQDGKVYKRVYAAPMAAHDTRTKDATSADFKRMTEGKNVKMGELYNISRELSEQRAQQNGGVDPVKEKFYKDYESQNKTKHPDVIKRETRAKLRKDWGIVVED